MSMRISFASTLDFHFVGFGQHRHRDRRSMHAALLFGRRNALHAMHAAFVLQLAVDLVAADQRDHFLQSAHRRFAGRSDFHLPAARFREARVHAENLVGEQRGFVAAGAGADFEHHVLLVVADPWAAAGSSARLRCARSPAPGAPLPPPPCRAIRDRIPSASAALPARFRVAVFHSRYLLTISASSLCALLTLRYCAESLMTAGSAIWRVQVFELAFDVVEFLLVLHRSAPGALTR